MCSVKGCELTHEAKGYCHKHYHSFVRYGDPLFKKREVGAPSQFFVECLLTNTDECIEWPFAKLGRGYGQLTVGGKKRPAHRIACEIINGPPPTDEHVAAHNCGNGHLGCVNPRHVRWATPAENQADCVLHGTDSRGEKAHRAKLTEEDVREIWSLIGSVSLGVIAKRFSVSKGAVQQISEGKTWAWLTMTLGEKGRPHG